MTYRCRAPSTRRGLVLTAVLGTLGAAAATGLPVLSAAAAADDAHKLVENVTSCVVEAAQKMKAPDDPLSFHYTQTEREKLAKDCGGDPTTYLNQHSMPIHYENPVGPGSAGLQEILRCRDVPEDEAVGDYSLWTERNMCVARFEWIDDAQKIYYEFAVLRGELNSANSWRAWLRTDSPEKHPQARHIKGIPIPRGSGPSDPGDGSGPSDPGSGSGPSDPGSGTPPAS